MSFSEILLFVLPHHRRSEFLQLRNYLSLHGIREQDFGDLIAPANAALPVERDEMCWVIGWPQNSPMRTNSDFRAQLGALGKSPGPKSLLFNFENKQLSELTKALQAPICEFAIINLAPNAPKSDAGFKNSMHKTYTDCYRMQGFVGGEWAYASNTNDTNGLLADEARDNWIDEKERDLACYYLGWESIEAHQAACKTAIFDEEMVKLAPWFGRGSGAWYVRFEKHV